MTRIAAIKELRDRLNYYHVVHDATCRCWRFDEGENLKHCTCDVGAAFKNLIRSRKPKK